jgi:hypothetical protein
MIEVQNNKREPSAGLAPSGETMIDLHYAPMPRAAPVQGLAIGKFEGAVRRGSA